MKEIRSTDLLIIGAGPGGYVAAIRARKKGLNVVLVERRFIGGTCLNIGCIPTKSLVKAVEVYKEAINAQAYGISAEHVVAHLDVIQIKKTEVATSLVAGIQFLLAKHGVNVVLGTASFLDDHTVSVQTEEGVIVYRPKYIIIATGAKTKRLNIERIGDPKVHDSESLLNNSVLPKSMIVIGGGVIGMEFAFIYGNLGTLVQVVEFLPSILPSVDRDIAQRLYRTAKMANVQITNNAAVTKIERLADGLTRVYYQQSGEFKYLDAELVLEAVGRVPETDGLHLENTTIVKSIQGGIPVDDYMRTNVQGVYAIGDVTHRIQLAHVASHQAMTAVDHLLGVDHPMHYDAIPSVIYTDPTIATVGLTEVEMARSGREFSVVKVPYSANGKALINHYPTGIVKLLKETTSGHVIGASIFGPDADLLIAPITLAIATHLPEEAIRQTIFAHPTTAELIHEAYLATNKEAIHFLD